MTPVQPRDDGRPVVVYAADQPQYHPLPTTVGPGPEIEVTSEWQLDDAERAALLAGGRVRLKLWTFGAPLHPIQLEVVAP